MKALKFLFPLVLLLTSFNLAFSQEDKGQVYLIRSTGSTGMAVNYSLFIDGSLVCKLKNKSFSVHDLSAGDHTVSVVSGGISNGKKSPPLTFTVSKEKANYISVFSTQSGYANKITCQEITINSAKPLMAKAKQKTDCLAK